ncbi:MAG: phosphorylase family protein [Solirubrobacterales bacterium]
MSEAKPIHLRPSAPPAADALLPGDPARAMALAQLLLTPPMMSNHARGLWGYTGVTETGAELTIQSTGMGGPSAAIVLSELSMLGTRRAIRVGSCGALDPGLELGELITVERAIAADGTSAQLGGEGVVQPDPMLTEALEAEGAPLRTIASSDLFYEVDPERPRGWAEQGAAAVEMEAATLFALGSRIGVSVACLLVVSDVFEGNEPGEAGRRRIGDEALDEAVERMGRLAAAALTR